MARHRRQASVQAEAINKKIAEQLLADAEAADRAAAMASDRAMVTSGRSNPLRSFGNNTPTPEPSFATPGGIMGSGVQDRKEAAGKPTLMQQIQQAKAMGIDAGEAIMGGPTRSGNTQPTSTPKKPNGGAGVQPNKSTGGLGRTGQPGATPTQENKPFSTPSNKDKKPNSGSTQKKLNSNKGSLPSLHPVVENGNVQKRPVSTYLEDVPNNQEQEREHKRPAQRQWVAPGQIRRPLNGLASTNFFQQDLRKTYNDPETTKLLGPECTSDPKQCNISHLQADLFREQADPSHQMVFGFDGLPLYPPPAKTNPGAALGKPVSDSFGIHQQYFKHLDEKSKTGVELDEDQREEHRLHSTFMKLMGNQKKNLEEMKTKQPLTETFHQRFELSERDRSALALMKLKPARKKKADPPLFAEGTWHNSRRMEDEDATGCSFCMFDCDYGVSDERVWLPIEASGVFCSECHEETITSIDQWEIKFHTDRDVRQAWREDGVRMEELHKTAATPPLKELADSGYFKFQALQRRELRKETLNERRQVQLDTLRGIEVAQQYGQQVMSAFNGARGQISPTVPRNVHNPPPISPTTVLNTFSTEDRTRFQSWFHSLAPQQKHQLMAHLRSLDAMGQWQVFADCCRPGFAANDIANPQAMATLVENLSPSQRQFMMQNTSPSTRGLMSPMIGGDSFGPSQMINNGTAGSNHQRSLSDGNRLSALQPSAQTTFSTTGASNTQQVGAAAHGHQRRASYTGLPPPSPKTLVNFGEAIDGQSNRLPGPGGDPLFASMGNQEMPGNFHRTTSTLQPAGMMMHNANLSPNFPPNGWSMNSPGGSPSIQQSSFNSGTPASNYQQIPPSNANLMPHFPAMVAYGAESSNNRRGPPMNGPGGSPPMQPSILDESLAIEPWVVNDPYQSPLSNNGNHIAPLQTPTNKQSVQVIKLTKSGGIIGPTTIPTSSNCLAPANTIPTHRQISSSHQPTRSISGPGSCPANHTPGMGNSIARSHPPGSSPLTSAPIHGLGIFNGLMMIGSANSNDPSSHFGALKPPQQAQTNALQASVAFPIPRVSALESNSNTSAPHPASRPFTLDHQSHAHPYPPVLRHAHTAPPNSGNMAPPHPEFRRTFSQSDARNSPQFQKLLFCRGCPWRQIDITKARICEGCKADKLKIITHRHFVFGPLHRGVAFELGEGVGHGQLANTNARTCMVCTGLATTKCVDCPLRLCTSCQVTLSSQCKGQISTLIGVLARHRVHMRNDVGCFLPASNLPYAVRE